MSSRLTTLLATLSLGLVLVACGQPVVVALPATASPPATATASPPATVIATAAPPTAAPPTAAPPTTAPPTATAVPPVLTATPRAHPPLRPAPDPAAVAAGAPLRAILLAQIDTFEARCTATPAASPQSCYLRTGEVNGPPELAAYVGWRQHTDTCVAMPQSDQGYAFLTILAGFSPEHLRAQGPLDAYVAGSTWCGRTGAKPTP